MFRRILIPLDGSETAVRVLPAVEKMLLREDGVAVLITAVPCSVIPTPHPASALCSVETPVLAQLKKQAGELEGKGILTETRLIHGGPAETILTYAEQEEVDLIAMSTHGRTGFTRFMMGSVAEKVIRNCPRPVLAVRAFAGDATPLAPRPFKNLLLPIDETPQSETILPMGMWLAQLYGAKIVLLHVMKRPENGNEAATWREHELAAHDRMSHLAGHLQNMGSETLYFVRSGDPADQILRFAEENGTDLICMTTHGRKGISRWVTGSVAERVLRHAHTPLLLTRLTLTQKRESTRAKYVTT